MLNEFVACEDRGMGVLTKNGRLTEQDSELSKTVSSMDKNNWNYDTSHQSSMQWKLLKSRG